MIETPFGIRSEIRYWPSKPVRDPDYRRWVKSLPCAAPQEFAEQHQIDVPALTARLNCAYTETVKGKVA
jgi:hypothetical protein